MRGAPDLPVRASAASKTTPTGNGVLRFACVGLASTLLYFTGAALLTAGTPPLLGAGLGSFLTYCACAVFSYLGHKHFTFRSNGAHGTEVPRFLALTGIGLTLAYALPTLLSDRLGLAPIVPVTVTTIAIPVFNYVALHFWVFAVVGGRS